VFTVVTGGGGELAVLTPDGTVRGLPGTEGSAQPHYLDTGHLVFFRSGGLAVAPFDPASGELTAAIDPVVDDVLTGWDAGLDLGMFAVSSTGDLVHFASESTFEQNQIVLVDRQGGSTPLPGDRLGKYSYVPAVSPDGTLLAVTSRSDRPSGDVWVRNLEMGSRQRLTFGERSVSIGPKWTTDGRRLFFAAYNLDANDPFDIYWMLPDGSDSKLMLSRPYSQFPSDVSDDYLVFRERHPETGQDLYLWSLDGGNDATDFATTEANEFDASFSPDGRFIAYVSDETGQNEVYVKPVDGSVNGIPVSTDGGISPRWSPIGDELFYLRDSTMMVADVALAPTFERSAPRPLFTGAFDSGFDIIPAGPHFVPGDTRFVMLTLQRPDLTQLIVSLNWAAELQAR
jgi:dipeptidyl aminopeptidase/acylaminoacyl peptidase